MTKKIETVKMFRALGNERRFMIMEHLLQRGELTVGRISALISLSFKSVSRHLSVLKNAGLVSSRQDNLNHFYSVNQEQMKHFNKFFS